MCAVRPTVSVEGGSIRFTVGSGLSITAQRGDVTDRLSDLDAWVHTLYAEYDTLNASLWINLNAANASLTGQFGTEAARAVPIETSLASAFAIIHDMQCDALQVWCPCCRRSSLRRSMRRGWWRTARATAPTRM